MTTTTTPPPLVDGDAGFISDESSFCGDSPTRAHFEALLASSPAPLELCSFTGSLTARADRAACVAAPSASLLRTELMVKLQGGGEEGKEEEEEEEEGGGQVSRDIKTHAQPKQQPKEPKATKEVEKEKEKEEEKKEKKDEKLYNPYSSHPHNALQINESIPSFLTRLPPSTTFSSTSTSSATVGPWIYVANFFSSSTRVTDADYASFARVGTALLAEYEEERDRIEAKMRLREGQPPLGRMLKPMQVKVAERILDAAREKGVRSGKWMIFVPEGKGVGIKGNGTGGGGGAEIDRVWKIVVEGTVEGTLGIAAKVATKMPDLDDRDDENVDMDMDGENRNGNVRRRRRVRSDSSLICVYTKDFSDLQDVKRVLDGLIVLGLVSPLSADGRQRGIFYKCDAYTHLGIESNNNYGLKASLYSSRDMLSGKGPGGAAGAKAGEKRKQTLLVQTMGGRRPEKKPKRGP
ncbi:hypothetical protein MMC25_003717 [Agyrium rufum]|nr:hypothetical protein [Agyrium rufum]